MHQISEDYLRNNKSFTFEDIYTAEEEIPNIEAHLNEHQPQIIILGRAGIGKSTFCQYSVYRWAKQQAWQQFAAVYWLPLRFLRHFLLNPTLIKTIELTNLGIAEFIAYCLQKMPYSYDSTWITPDTIHKQLSDATQKTLFILDGYDEIKHLLNSDIQVKEFFTLLCKQKYRILTSRPYAIQAISDFASLSCYELMGFANQDIPDYIQKIFKVVDRPETEAYTLIQFLKKHPSIWGTAHVPIHLALICLFWTPDTFKDYEYCTMTELYHYLIQKLALRYLEQYCPKETIANLTAKEIEAYCTTLFELLGELSLQGLLDNDLVFETKKHIAPLLKKYKVKLIDHFENLKKLKPFASQEEKQQAAFILAIKKAGFLNTLLPSENNTHSLDKHELYYFLHATFQEFFAAYYLKKKLITEEKINFLIEKQRYRSKKAIIKYFIKSRPAAIVLWFLAGLLKENQKELEGLFKLLDTPSLDKKPKEVINYLQVDNNVARLFLSLRCFEEAELAIKNQQHFNSLTETFRTLAEYTLAEQPSEFNPYYRSALHYFKLSPRLLKQARILDRLQEIKDYSADRSTWAEIVLKQLEEGNIIEFLINHIKSPNRSEPRIKAIQALSALVDKSDKQEISLVCNALWQYTLENEGTIQFHAAQSLLQLDRERGVVALIKCLISDDRSIQPQVIKTLIDENQITLLSRLMEIDKRIRANMFRYFNVDNKNLRTDDKIDCLFVGSESVGKYAIITRFIEDKFTKISGKKVEDHYTVRINQVANVFYRLHTKDTDGHVADLFKVLDIDIDIINFIDVFTEAHICIICFALNSNISYEDISKIYLEANDLDIPIMLVGTKKDLVEDRVLSYENGKALAAKISAKYFECSAKTGEGINEIFNEAIMLVQDKSIQSIQYLLFKTKTEIEELIKKSSNKLDKDKANNLLIEVLSKAKKDPRAWVKQRSTNLLEKIKHINLLEKMKQLEWEENKKLRKTPNLSDVVIESSNDKNLESPFHP